MLGRVKVKAGIPLKVGQPRMVDGGNLEAIQGRGDNVWESLLPTGWAENEKKDTPSSGPTKDA